MNSKETLNKIISIAENYKDDDMYVVYEKAKAFDEITVVLKQHLFDRMMSKPYSKGPEEVGDG